MYTYAHISDTTCLYIAMYTFMCKHSLYSYWNANLELVMAFSQFQYSDHQCSQLDCNMLIHTVHYC